MTYVIAEPCIDIKDRSCVDVCPVDCIHEAGRMLVIDPEECIDCGACEPECPVEAIFPEDALPEKWEPFVKHQRGLRRGHGHGQRARRRVRDRAQRPERAAGVGRTARRSAGRIRLRIPMADDLHKLSAPYALDALDGDDRARFEEHLAGCEQCRGELAGLARRRRRARLRGRRAGAAARRCAGASSTRRAPRSGRTSCRSAPRRLGASTFAATRASPRPRRVALGVWAASLHHSLAHERSALSVLERSARAPHIRCRAAPGALVVAPSGEAVLALAPAGAAAGKTYEAWVVERAVHRAGEFAGESCSLRARVEPARE